MADKTPLLDDDRQTTSPNESDEVFRHAHREELDRGIGELNAHANHDIKSLEKKGTVPSASPEANHTVNLTGKTPKAGVAGLVDQLKNLRDSKDKGPIAILTSLVVIVITIVGIFGGTSLLGQSISGNILARFNSGLSMMRDADNSLVGPRLFGGATCSTKTLVCNMQGVTAAQLDDMKANGAKFTPENGRAVDADGKIFIFDSVEVNGTVINADNINEHLKNPKIKKILLPITKPPTWAAQKNNVRQRVKTALGVNENPDTNAKDKKQLAQKMYENTQEGGRSISSTRPSVEFPETEEGAADPRIGQANVDLGAINLSSEATRLGTRAAAGQLTNNVLPTDDLAEAIGGEGRTLESAENVLKQGWRWINSVDVLDVVCTSYQIGNTIAQIARTISMVNTVRYGFTFLAAWDKVKAGDSSPGEINELMNSLTALNKYGESFDSSVGMQYIFTGKLTTSSPSAVSTVGGATIQTLTAGFQQVNRLFDPLAFANGQSSAIRGYRTIKTACSIATNLGFQIAATIVDWGVTLVAAPFTGGGSLVANIGGKAGLKTALKLGKEALLKVMKEKIVNVFSKNVDRAVQKAARKDALRTVRAQLTDPVQGAMVALTLVETFGLDYIAQSLAGTDVIAYLNNSVQSADAIVAAGAYVDTAAVIEEGGEILSVQEAQVAMDENKKATQENIAFEKEIADPFDINNPYSAVGSFAAAFAGQLGGINQSSLLSGFKDVLNIPLTSFSKLSSATANAATDSVTSQELSDFINDPVLKELNIGNDVMGNVAVGGVYKGGDPIELMQNAIDKGYIRPNGAIVKSSAYGKHVEDCNNSAKAQVDETLFPEAVIQPAYCRDGTAQRQEFNDISKIRALTVDESSSSVPSDGTKAEIAQRIIDKGNLSLWSGNGGVWPSLQDIADGTNNGNDKPCGINIYILKILDVVTDLYPVSLSDLNRGCETIIPGGDPYARDASGNPQSGPSSAHWAGNGSAVDFDVINGVNITGRDATSRKVIELIMPILLEANEAAAGNGGGGSVLGQRVARNGVTPCGPEILTPGVAQIADGCNHLHVSVPPNADVDLVK